MMESLLEAATVMQGVLHGQDRKFRGVSTDTRTLREGELFFALSGPNFDGKDYVGAAKAAGAAAAVVAGTVDEDLAANRRE